MESPFYDEWTMLTASESRLKGGYSQD